MPRPKTAWLLVCEVRLSRTCPMSGKPWAHKDLFGPRRQAQSTKPPPPPNNNTPQRLPLQPTPQQHRHHQWQNTHTHTTTIEGGLGQHRTA